MTGISKAIWISFRIYAFDVDHISNCICRIELVGWGVESSYLLLSKIPGNVGMTEWLGQLYLNAEHALSVELLVFFCGPCGLSRTVLHSSVLYPELTTRFFTAWRHQHPMKCSVLYG